MKNKAKWTALLLCGILLLNGCGAATDDDSTDQTDVINTVTEAPAETPATDANITAPTEAPADVEETPAPTPAPTEAPADTPADATEPPAPTEAPVDSTVQTTIPKITVLPTEKIWYAEDGTTLLTVNDFSLSIEGDGYEALQNTFDNMHPGVKDENYQSLYDGAAEHYEFSPDSFYGYSSSCEAQLSRCDNSVVSFRIFTHDYTGGAHGMYLYYGETYDVETGQALKLADIVADAEGFYPNAIEYINNALYKEYEDALFADYQTWVADSLSPAKESLWYMTSTGIVICFSPYEVGPYAMGAPEITIPYSECAAYLHSKYLPSDGELVAKVGLNQDISSLIGVENPIQINAIQTDDCLDISVTSGSYTASLGVFDYFHSAYMLRRTDGRSFLFVTCDHMSDDYETFLYDITDGNLIKYGALSNTILTGRSLTSQNIEMEVRVDALGSYRAFANFLLTPEATLALDGDFYQIDSTYPLNIINSLPVTLEGADTVLDAGTQIIITGTNLVDEIYFKVVGTEQTGTIRYTRGEEESWIIYIDGISEYVYFDNLPYAG